MPFLRRSLAAALTSSLLAVMLPTHTTAQSQAQTVRTLDRPAANPVKLSRGFRRAVEAGTRTMDGVPGPDYWQQTAAYTINATLDVDEKKLEGTTRILYRNNSPDTLTAN